MARPPAHSNPVSFANRRQMARAVSLWRASGKPLLRMATNRWRFSGGRLRLSSATASMASMTAAGRLSQ